MNDTHQIIVAGIGPGNRSYILPEALHAIEGAEFLVGGTRALQTFAKPGQTVYAIRGKLSLLAEWMEEALNTADVVVMVSGDPGYYSLLPWLKRTFPEVSLSVIPGISSFQYAFARLGEPWQNAECLSFHGRVPDEKKLSYEKGKVCSFLTDRIYDPAAVARVLLGYGWPENTRAAVCENLSYENEKILDSVLSEITDYKTAGESVLLVFG